MISLGGIIVPFVSQPSPVGNSLFLEAPLGNSLKEKTELSVDLVMIFSIWMSLISKK